MTTLVNPKGDTSSPHHTNEYNTTIMTIVDDNISDDLTGLIDHNSNTTARGKKQPIKSKVSSPKKKKQSNTFFFGFPAPVKMILFNELTERFAYYGNRAILTLFLISIDFDTTKAVVVYSLQSALSCTMPLLGGHIADAWWGRYWTIVVFSMVYFIGALLLAFCADPDYIDSKKNPIYIYIALLLTALGTGGIKPCVSTFGAEQVISITSKINDDTDIINNNSNNKNYTPNNKKELTQHLHNSNNTGLRNRNDKLQFNDDLKNDSFQGSSFATLTNDEINHTLSPNDENYSNMDTAVLPNHVPTDIDHDITLDIEENDDDDDEEEEEEMSSESFFITFYFMMNVGSILATIVIPTVRSHVSYFWAFLLPAAFMLISVLILVIGRIANMFKLTPPDGGILGKVFRLLWRACKRIKYGKRAYVIPIPISEVVTDDIIDENGNVTTRQHTETKITNVLVGVHDFVRFVHLNYDYTMNRLYNPTFNPDNNTILAPDDKPSFPTTVSFTNNNNNNSNKNNDTYVPNDTTTEFTYETPDWLVPLYTCPYDPTPSKTLAEVDTLSPLSLSPQLQEQDQSTKKNQTKQLAINYGSCQCSEGCTCGCGCNNTSSGTITSHNPNTFTVQHAQNSSLPANTNNFNRSLQEDPPSSPCQCTTPITTDELSQQSKIKLHHFYNASDFLGQSHSIRHDVPQPHVFDSITTNQDYSPYYQQPSPSDENDPTVMSTPLAYMNQPQHPYRNRKFLCLREFTHLSQIFPRMDLTSDEYTLLEYIDKESFAYKNKNVPISLDELALPLSYGKQTKRTNNSNQYYGGDDDDHDEDDINNNITNTDSSETTPVFTPTVLQSDQQGPTTEANQQERNISLPFIQALRIVFVIIPVLLTLPVFWSLMNQQGSTWMVQAQEMDLNIYIFNLDKKGWKIEPEQLSILNPLFLFVFLPILDRVARAIKPSKNKKNSNPDSEQSLQNGNDTNGDTTLTRSPTTTTTKMLPPSKDVQKEDEQTISATSLSSPLTKMILGMVFAAVAYVCAAFVDMYIRQAAKTIDPVTDLPGKISILWQVPQYLFVTMAEVCISVTGLYFVFDMSPSNMKSLVNALFLFSGALGDFLTGLFYTVFEKWGFSRLQMFLGFAVSIMINSLGIVFIQHIFGKLYKFK